MCRKEVSIYILCLVHRFSCRPIYQYRESKYDLNELFVENDCERSEKDDGVSVFCARFLIG
jgi:hypothetical protein